MALEQADSLVESTSPDVEWAFQLRNVGQTFGERAGIRVSSLRIRSGKITALVGRSGAGKSTLLHLLGSMLDAETLDPGVLLEARLQTQKGFTTQDVLRNKWHGSEGKIGFVFQEPFLIRDASCRLNIELSLAAAGQKVDAAEVRRLWDKLAISTDRFDLPARHLSGGMQQRVAVGRAIVRQPQIILADEPTASLDPALGFQIMELLQDWQCTAPHRSLIFVTHDIGLVERFADDVIVLDPAPVGAVGQGEATIGRLLPGIAWPISNPKDRKVIEAWMNAGGGAVETMPAASASSRKHDDSAERPKPTCGADANSPKEGSGWAGANLSVWYQMALATAFNGEPRNKSVHAQPTEVTLFGYRIAVPASHWTIRLALGFAGGLLLFVAIALLVVSRTEQRSVVGVLLLMPALALLLPRLWSRLGLATYFRSLVLGVLTIIGLVSLVAIGLVRVAADHHLSIPALQVWLASQSKQAYTMKFVDEMQKDLVDTKIVPPPAAASERTVFGRHMVFQLASFVPVAVPPSGPPDCNSDDNLERKYSAAVSALGVSVNEPILSELSWWPVLENKAIKIQELAGGAPRAPEAGLPALSGDVKGGALYVSRAALTKDLQLPLDSDVPRWLCVDIGRVRDYAPFRVTAVIDSLPGFDKAEFSYVLGTQAAAAAVDRAGIDQPSAVSYGLLAIRIPAHSRDAILEYLRKAADAGKIAPEVGFAKLLEAVGAASVSVWLARAFAIIVLVLACVVTTVFIFQFIETNRRELSVALAFGAKLHQLTVLIFTLLLIPFGIALVSAAVVAAFILPPLMEIVAGTFRVPAPSQLDVLIAFAWVVVLGIGLIFGVSVLTLTVWRLSATSLATQLQEVG